MNKLSTKLTVISLVSILLFLNQGHAMDVSQSSSSFNPSFSSSADWRTAASANRVSSSSSCGGPFGPERANPPVSGSRGIESCLPASSSATSEMLSSSAAQNAASDLRTLFDVFDSKGGRDVSPLGKRVMHKRHKVQLPTDVDGVDRRFTNYTVRAGRKIFMLEEKIKELEQRIAFLEGQRPTVPPVSSLAGVGSSTPSPLLEGDFVPLRPIAAIPPFAPSEGESDQESTSSEGEKQAAGPFLPPDLERELSKETIPQMNPLVAFSSTGYTPIGAGVPQVPTICIIPVSAPELPAQLMGPFVLSTTPPVAAVPNTSFITPSAFYPPSYAPDLSSQFFRECRASVPRRGGPRGLGPNLNYSGGRWNSRSSRDPYSS